MNHPLLSRALTGVLAVAGFLALACGQSASSVSSGKGAQVQPAAPPGAPQSAAAAVPASSSTTGPEPTNAREASPANGDLVFTGTREETEQFIRHFQTIRLAPEQERIKVEALSAIPAPCCADNPLATCCCPCNMAKAAWGLSAWLITEKEYGVDEVRQAARNWLEAANPDGFSGDSCYSGGCGRAIHENGCGGMDDRHVL